MGKSWSYFLFLPLQRFCGNTCDTGVRLFQMELQLLNRFQRFTNRIFELGRVLESNISIATGTQREFDGQPFDPTFYRVLDSDVDGIYHWYVLRIPNLARSTYQNEWIETSVYSLTYFSIGPLVVHTLRIGFDEFFELRTQDHTRTETSILGHSSSWWDVLGCIRWVRLVTARHFRLFSFVIQIVLGIDRIGIIRWQRTAYRYRAERRCFHFYSIGKGYLIDTAELFQIIPDHRPRMTCTVLRERKVRCLLVKPRHRRSFERASWSSVSLLRLLPHCSNDYSVRTIGWASRSASIDQPNLISVVTHSQWNNGLIGQCRNIVN